MDIEKLKKHFSGKYEFIKLLGRGGFAEVHLAFDKMLERKVAIKILLFQHASDPDIVKRFIREARLYAKLEHPNLISIYETGTAEGTAFIVMRYVKGDNLKSYISRDLKTRIALAPAVVKSLSSALSYIHQEGIIHRDVKPANIILEENGSNIYLADFGIARSDSSQTMTQTGSIMGTPYYISPEQIKGGLVDHRSDIYAFGATLFELVAGKPVFSADSSVEILYKHVNSNPEPVWRSTPATPRNLRYIISKCLEKNPGKRFQAASEITEVLEGKQTISLTRYLSSIESGGRGDAKKKILLLASLILIPLITFFIYIGLSSINTKEPIAVVNKISEKRPEAVSGDEKIVNQKTMDTQEAAGTDHKLPESTIPDEKIENKTVTLSKNKSIKHPPVQKEKNIEPVEKANMNNPGKIRFSSYPPSDIYWNGVKLGNTTQIFNKDFPPGKYKFIFRIEGYMSEEKEISVESGKEVPVHFRFSPYGFITITAKPFARFYINGIDNGEDPIFEKKFPIGTYTIRAVKKGYTTEEKIIKIMNMKKTNINFSLKKGGVE